MVFNTIEYESPPIIIFKFGVIDSIMLIIMIVINFMMIDFIKKD